MPYKIIRINNATHTATIRNEHGDQRIIQAASHKEFRDALQRANLPGTFEAKAVAIAIERPSPLLAIFMGVMVGACLLAAALIAFGRL